jgi:hypothetical protein
MPCSGLTIGWMVDRSVLEPDEDTGMRQRTRARRVGGSGPLWPVRQSCFCRGHRSDAQAQTFNDVIQGALDGGGGGACNGLKGGPFQGSLNSICASPYPVPEGRARGYTLRDYDVVRRAIYSNPNNGLNAEGSGVNGFV